MDENALVHMKCPNCGKIHLNTLENLMAHWEQEFRCDDGCGMSMKLDRQELLDAIRLQTPPFAIAMHTIY